MNAYFLIVFITLVPTKWKTVMVTSSRLQCQQVVARYPAEIDGIAVTPKCVQGGVF